MITPLCNEDANRNFVSWCNQNLEMVVDFKKQPMWYSFNHVSGEVDELVDHYKYIDNVADCKPWILRTKLMARNLKLAKDRVRYVKYSNLTTSFCTIFTQSVLQSFLYFRCICFYGVLSNGSSNKLEKYRKWCLSKIPLWTLKMTWHMRKTEIRHTPNLPKLCFLTFRQQTLYPVKT